MKKRVSRREALKLGTSAAVAAAVPPILDGGTSAAALAAEHATASGNRAVAPANDCAICLWSSKELAAMIRGRKISSREMMQAHLKQISRLNGKLNAIVTLVDEDKLMAEALAADEDLVKGKVRGPLHGLPVGVKDLHETAGIRTTYGSPLHRDFVPDFDCRVVQLEKAAGAIVVGKTNVPEFGLGSQTFNPVFGPTRNPYDLSKTCGGSTGGGSAAMACGMLPLADGSDSGGSLRNPPSFCNVVGLRPSVGRVSNVPSQQAWNTQPVRGAVARSVADLAFHLSVLAGWDHHFPISIDQPGSYFAQPLERNFKGVKIAMFKDLGLPWEAEVKEAVRGQAKVFESLGCIVEEAEPDLSDANEWFLAWRHWASEGGFGDLMTQHGNELNEFIHWHVEEGRKLTGPYLARVEGKRWPLFQRMAGFFSKYEFFVMPVSQVLPFEVTQHFPTEIAGVKMESYMAWMKSCYWISATGCPAMSVPCAFSSSGLPIGMQIVGRFHDDFGVLQMGHAFEQATQIGKRRPAILTAA